VGYEAKKTEAATTTGTAKTEAAPTPGKSTRVLAMGAQPLPAGLRARMDAAFGRSFGDVRIHQDDVAAANGAKALTRGNDIHLAPGAYDPDSPDGIRLIAHELTHVVQQTQGRATVDADRPNPAATPEGRAPFEAEAEAVAERVAAGGHAGAIHGAVPFGTQQHEDQWVAKAREVLRMGERIARPRKVPDPTVIEVLGDRFRVSFERSAEYRFTAIVEYTGPLAHTPPLRLIAPPTWKSEDLDWNARVMEVRRDGLSVDLVGDGSHLVDVAFSVAGRADTREHHVRTSMDMHRGAEGQLTITLPKAKSDAPHATDAELAAEKPVELATKLGPDPVRIIARRFGDSGDVHVHFAGGTTAKNANLLLPVKGKGLAFRILAHEGNRYDVDLDGDGKADARLVHTMRRPITVGTADAPQELRWHEIRAYNLHGVRISEAFFTVKGDPKPIPDAVRADLHPPPEGQWQDTDVAPVQGDVMMEAPQLRGRLDNRELRIDADGDRQKEMLLRFHWVGDLLHVQAIQIATGMFHNLEPVKIPGGAGLLATARDALAPVVEKFADGHSPMRIELFGDTRFASRPTVKLVIHPPVPNPDTKLDEVRFELAGASQLGGYPKQPQSRTQLVGETKALGMPGGVTAVAAELGELRDRFLFTLEYAPSGGGLTFGIAGIGGNGVVVAGGARVHHDKPGAMLKKVESGPSSIAFSIDGDDKADIVVYDGIQAAPMVGASVEREHQLTIAGPAMARDHMVRIVCRGANFFRPWESGARNTVLDRDTSGALQAAATITDQAAGGHDVEAMARQFETGLSAQVVAAADKGLIPKKLFDAWKQLSEDIEKLQVLGAKRTPQADLDLRGRASSDAVTLYDALAAESDRTKHELPVISMIKVNDYTGEQTQDTLLGTKPVVTPGMAAYLGGAIGTNNYYVMRLAWHQLRSGVEKWALFRLEESQGKESTIVRQGRYTQAMAKELGEIKGKSKVTRVFASFIPDDSYRQEKDFFESLPLHVYVWRDGDDWYIRNLTNPEKPFTEHVSADGSDTPPKKLFAELNQKKAFPKGVIRYQVPGGVSDQVVCTADKKWYEWVAEIGLALAAIGFALATFGAGTVAVIGGYVMAASALAGAVAAGGELYDDYRHDQLTATTVVLNVLQIISGVASAGAIVAGNLVKGAMAAANAADKANWSGRMAHVAKFADKMYVPLVATGAGADLATVAVMGKDLIDKLDEIDRAGGDADARKRAKMKLIAMTAVMGGITALSVKGSLPEIKAGKVNIVLDTVGGHAVAHAGGVRVGGHHLDLKAGDVHGHAGARWNASSFDDQMKGADRKWYEAWLTQKEKVTFDANGEPHVKLPEIKGETIPPKVQAHLEEIAHSSKFAQQQKAFATAEDIAEVRRISSGLDIDPSSPIWAKERERLITKLSDRMDVRRAEQLVDGYAHARLGIQSAGHAAQHKKLIEVIPQDEINAIARNWPEFEVYVTGPSFRSGKSGSVGKVEVIVVVPEGTSADLIGAIEQRARGRRVRPDPDYIKSHSGKPDETLGLDVKVMTPDQMLGAATSEVKGGAATAMHRIDTPMTASGQPYTSAELSAFHKAGYEYDAATRQFKPRPGSSQVPFGAPATGSLHGSNIIVGGPMPSKAVGQDVLERLAAGESQALRMVGIEPPPGMDTRINEWGLGRRTKDGSYVLIKGEPTAVDWTNLHGIERVGHSHPLITNPSSPQSRYLKGKNGQGSVSFDELTARQGLKEDVTHLVPSGSDLATAARDGGDHLVVTPYVYVNGRITNPIPGESHPRVVFHITGSIPIAMIEGTPFVVYKARLRASAGGQPIGDAMVEGVQFGRHSHVEFGEYSAKKGKLDPDVRPGMEIAPVKGAPTPGTKTHAGPDDVMEHAPVKDLYKNVDTRPPPETKDWDIKLGDVEVPDPKKPHIQTLTTKVQVKGGGHATLTRTWDSKAKRFTMENIKMEGMPKKVMTDPPLQADGTPTSAYLTMLQMKKLKIGYGEVRRVKMQNVRNFETTLEVHFLTKLADKPVSMNEAVRQSKSVRYGRTPIEQSGSAVVVERVTWDKAKQTKITVQDLIRDMDVNAKDAADIIAGYNARIADKTRHISGSTVVETGFDINIRIDP
jgi:hypothetical protein